jgi:voltage-gated potassium channel
MQDLRSRLRILLGVFLAIMVLGVAGFMVVEDLSLIDALYFVIVTVATVGYGDIHPVTVAGKALAVLIIVLGVGTFLGVIATATETMLNRRERQARLEKLNVVIGAFYSEVGIPLLRTFTSAAPSPDAFCSDLAVSTSWTADDFARMRGLLSAHDYRVEVGEIDLWAMREFLLQRRGFMLSLLENPTLSEHETFTSILWAVFHLAEELSYRDNLAALPETDLAHLAGDMKRAYGFLGVQWLDYMEHLRGAYPYLFSLAMRTNPFDRNASPVVQ